MRLTMLVLVVMCLALVMVPAQAATGLPIGSVDAVWVQPLDGSPGQTAGALGLKWPDLGSVKLDTLPVFSTIKPQVIIANGNPGVSVLPGLAAVVETETAVKLKAGIVYLPTTKYKAGWFIGAQVLAVSW